MMKQIGASVGAPPLYSLGLALVMSLAFTGCSSDVVVSNGENAQQKPGIVIEPLAPGEDDDETEYVAAGAKDEPVGSDDNADSEDRTGVSNQCRRDCVIADLEKDLSDPANSRLKSLLRNIASSPQSVRDKMKGKYVRVRSPLPGPPVGVKLGNLLDENGKIKNTVAISEDGSVMVQNIRDRKGFAATVIDEKLVVGGGKSPRGVPATDVVIFKKDGTKQTISNIVSKNSTKAPQFSKLTSSALVQAGLSANLAGQLLVGSVNATGVFEVRAANMTTGTSVPVDLARGKLALAALQ